MSLSKKRRRLLLLPIPAVAAVAIGAVAATAAFAHSSLEWKSTETPDLGEKYSLRSVEALAEDDVWAVGYDYLGEECFALHWDGAAWAATPTPKGSWFSDVSGIDGGEVWAVGSADGGSTHTSRWDGKAWETVPTPEIEQDEEEGAGLTSVDGAASDDVWAVGTSGDANYPEKSEAILQHWNGSEWSLVDVPLPEGAAGTTLSSVVARASDDVWAIGTAIEADGAFSSMLLHWDGAEWSVRDLSVPDYRLNDITVDEDGRVWLVGAVHTDGVGDGEPIMIVGDGEKFDEVETPLEEGILNAVAPDGDGGVVAVGDDFANSQAIVLNSDGETVTREASPAVEAGVDWYSLEGVSLVPGTETLWTVGFVNKYETPVSAHTA